MCDLLYATESFYKRIMKRVPLDPNIKIRPSEEDCRLLLGLGHNWAAGFQPVQEQRMQSQAHAFKRTAEQAGLDDANRERAKRAALEYQVAYGKQMVESLREENERLRRDLAAARANIASYRTGQSCTATQPSSLDSQPLEPAVEASRSRLEDILVHVKRHGLTDEAS
jgi:hypothetical protein